MDEEIIRIVNQICLKHIEFHEHHAPKGLINLKNTRISDIVLNKKNIKNDFYSYLHSYRSNITIYFLCERLDHKTIDISEEYKVDIILENRKKSTSTMTDKIERYMNNQSIKGRVSVNKCLNDLIGYRLIIEFNNDLEDFEKYLDKLLNYSPLKSSQKLKFKLRKVVNDRKKGVYQAIHLVIYIDNFTFPWEVQFWRKVDSIQNKESHFHYKQSHIGLKKSIDSVQ